MPKSLLSIIFQQQEEIINKTLFTKRNKSTTVSRKDIKIFRADSFLGEFIETREKNFNSQWTLGPQIHCGLIVVKDGVSLVFIS